MKSEIKHILNRYARSFACGLILCAGFLALSSCSYTEYPIPEEIVPGDTLLGKGYISLSINTEKILLTKTFEGYEQGLPGETYVKAVRVVLYDGCDMTNRAVVKYAFDYSIETATNTPYWSDMSSGKKDLSPLSYMFSSSNFVTYAREIKVQPYRMLVIINPANNNNSALDLYNLTREGVSKLEDIYRAVTLDPEKLRDGGIAADNCFLMLNDQGLVDIPAGWIQESISMAHRSPVPVNVERVVAKVSLFPANPDAIGLPDGASINDLTWTLDIVNKKTYWMRQMTKTFMATGETGPEEVVCIHQPGKPSPDRAGTDREKRYASDPNYNGYKGNSIDNINERKNNFLCKSYTDGQALLSLDIQPGQSAYCLENTMHPDDQSSEVITRALIRCAYYPQKIRAGQSYYIFNDATLISVEQMKDYISLINQGKGNNWNDAELRKLFATLKAAKTVCVLDAEPAESFIYAYSGNTLRYYRNGINYYAVKIRHFDYAPSVTDDAYGFYGVVRNTHYKVTVKEFLGPGEPVIAELEYKTRSSEEIRQDNLFNISATFERVK